MSIFALCKLKSPQQFNAAGFLVLGYV